MAKIATMLKTAQRFLPLTFRITLPERSVDLGKLVTMPPGFSPTNPAVVKVGDQFLIGVRGVNYTIDDPRSMRPRSAMRW